MDLLPPSAMLALIALGPPFVFLVASTSVLAAYRIRRDFPDEAAMHALFSRTYSLWRWAGLVAGVSVATVVHLFVPGTGWWLLPAPAGVLAWLGCLIIGEASLRQYISPMRRTDLTVRYARTFLQTGLALTAALTVTVSIGAAAYQWVAGQQLCRGSAPAELCGDTRWVSPEVSVAIAGLVIMTCLAGMLFARSVGHRPPLGTPSLPPALDSRQRRRTIYASASLVLLSAAAPLSGLAQSIADDQEPLGSAVNLNGLPSPVFWVSTVLITWGTLGSVFPLPWNITRGAR